MNFALNKSKSLLGQLFKNYCSVFTQKSSKYVHVNKLIANLVHKGLIFKLKPTFNVIWGAKVSISLGVNSNLWKSKKVIPICRLSTWFYSLHLFNKLSTYNVRQPKLHQDYFHKVRSLIDQPCLWQLFKRGN